MIDIDISYKVAVQFRGFTLVFITVLTLIRRLLLGHPFVRPVVN